MQKMAPTQLDVVVVLSVMSYATLTAADTTNDFGWTSWYSEEHGGLPSSIIGDYPVTGMQCRNKFCDDITIQKAKEIWDGKIMHKIRTDAAFVEKKVSDEQGHVRCPQGQVVKDSRCVGRYCNYSYLRCSKPRGFFPVWGQFSVTQWFSEQQKKPFYCPRGWALVGLYCRDKFCSNKRLECAELKADRVLYQPIKGEWKFACSINNVGQGCSVGLKESISRSGQDAWEKGYSDSVKAAISFGIEGFGSTSLEVSHTVSSSVSKMLGWGKTREVSCGISASSLPNSGVSSTVWQMKVVAKELRSSSLNMPLCVFWVTPAGLRPRCEASRCAEPWCQHCRKACSGPVPGSFSYCSAKCTCPERAGGCSSDSACETGLKCCKRVGCRYGYAPNISLCLKDPECRSLKPC